MRVNDSNSSGAGTVLLGIVAVALAGMVGTMGLINQVGEFGPKVGDIVAFEPLDPISSDMRARLPAMLASGRSGVACVLDVRAMHANGGSMVIESREPGTNFSYRVHWAGPRSSNDSTDCGASADLLLNLEDVEVLAMAAGGYGAASGKQGGAVLARGQRRAVTRAAGDGGTLTARGGFCDLASCHTGKSTCWRSRACIRPRSATCSTWPRAMCCSTVRARRSATCCAGRR